MSFIGLPRRPGKAGVVVVLFTFFMNQAVWCAPVTRTDSWNGLSSRNTVFNLKTSARALEAMQGREDIAPFLESFLDKRDQEFLHVAELSLVVPSDVKFRVNGSKLVLSSPSGFVTIEVVNAAKRAFSINGHRWAFNPDAPLQASFRVIDRLIGQATSQNSTPSRGHRQAPVGDWLESAAHADGGFSAFCSSVYLIGLILTGLTCLGSSGANETGAQVIGRCGVRALLWPLLVLAELLSSSAHAAERPWFKSVKCPAENGGTMQVTLTDGTEVTRTASGSRFSVSFRNASQSGQDLTATVDSSWSVVGAASSSVKNRIRALRAIDVLCGNPTALAKFRQSVIPFGAPEAPTGAAPADVPGALPAH